MNKLILYLKTADNQCYLALENTGKKREFSWQSGRNLSDGLLSFLQQSLREANADWADVTAIVAFRGPGSYTSLRIGLTVVNSLADGLGVPIVGVDGEDWQMAGAQRLVRGENDKIVLPVYLQPAVITSPKK